MLLPNMYNVAHVQHQTKKHDMRGSCSFIHGPPCEDRHRKNYFTIQCLDDRMGVARPQTDYIALKCA
jgi:hypothetical protein